MPHMAAPVNSHANDQQAGEKSVPHGAFPARVQTHETSSSHSPAQRHAQGQQVGGESSAVPHGKHPARAQSLRSQSSGEQAALQGSASTQARNQEGQQRPKTKVPPPVSHAEPKPPDLVPKSTAPTPSVNPMKTQAPVTSTRTSSKATAPPSERDQGVSGRKANPGNLLSAALGPVKLQVN